MKHPPICLAGNQTHGAVVRSKTDEKLCQICKVYSLVSFCSGSGSQEIYGNPQRLFRAEKNPIFRQIKYRFKRNCPIGVYFNCSLLYPTRTRRCMCVSSSHLADVLQLKTKRKWSVECFLCISSSLTLFIFWLSVMPSQSCASRHNAAPRLQLIWSTNYCLSSRGAHKVPLLAAVVSISAALQAHSRRLI